MLPSLVVSALAAASAVQAAPFFSASSRASLVKRADTPSKHDQKIQDVQIHESCNAAQTAYLRRGLNEMRTISEHAYNRILDYGEEDPLYVKYFGNVSSATTSGFYAQIVWGNKPGVLLRCDNPDGNCEQTTAAGPWAGHYRGKNATLETVICEPTFHRITHVPSVTYNHVGHASDSYAGALALAAANDTLAGFNQNTFQYYAIDAYARDVAHPPNGCTVADEDIPAEEEGHDHGAASTSASATATATEAATATSSAAESCHTHADGEIHCV
ncbi:hypothetical protein JCM10207_007782 [Rhodosporidiobolus poonsookiae]